MESIIKAIIEAAETFDKMGQTKLADSLDTIAHNVLDIKTAQYVGVQGYWIRNSRCWGNCFRQKRAGSPTKPIQEVWSECHEEYVKSINNDGSTWDKYAENDVDFIKISKSMPAKGHDAFLKTIASSNCGPDETCFNAIMAVEEDYMKKFNAQANELDSLVEATNKALGNDAGKLISSMAHNLRKEAQGFFSRMRNNLNKYNPTSWAGQVWNPAILNPKQRMEFENSINRIQQAFSLFSRAKSDLKNLANASQNQSLVQAIETNLPFSIDQQISKGLQVLHSSLSQINNRETGTEKGNLANRALNAIQNSGPKQGPGPLSPNKPNVQPTSANTSPTSNPVAPTPAAAPAAAPAPKQKMAVPIDLLRGNPDNDTLGRLYNARARLQRAASKKFNAKKYAQGNPYPVEGFSGDELSKYIDSLSLDEINKLEAWIKGGKQGDPFGGTAKPSAPPADLEQTIAPPDPVAPTPPSIIKREDGIPRKSRFGPTPSAPAINPSSPVTIPQAKDEPPMFDATKPDFGEQDFTAFNNQFPSGATGGVKPPTAPAAPVLPAAQPFEQPAQEVGVVNKPRRTPAARAPKPAVAPTGKPAVAPTGKATVAPQARARKAKSSIPSGVPADLLSKFTWGKEGQPKV